MPSLFPQYVNREQAEAQNNELIKQVKDLQDELTDLKAKMLEKDAIIEDLNKTALLNQYLTDSQKLFIMNKNDELKGLNDEKASKLKEEAKLQAEIENIRKDIYENQLKCHIAKSDVHKIVLKAIEPIAQAAQLDPAVITINESSVAVPTSPVPCSSRKRSSFQTHDGASNKKCKTEEELQIVYQSFKEKTNKRGRTIPHTEIYDLVFSGFADYRVKHVELNENDITNINYLKYIFKKYYFFLNLYNKTPSAFYKALTRTEGDLEQKYEIYTSNNIN